MKVYMDWMWQQKTSTDYEPAPKDKGRIPKAICSGTLLPCSSNGRCKHFGVHQCTTFKKHRKHECPHYPERGFICMVVK